MAAYTISLFAMIFVPSLYSGLVLAASVALLMALWCAPYGPPSPGAPE